MEKKKWSLIFLALCLALALTSNPVEAQDICDPGNFCDRDEDTWFKVHQRCTTCPNFTDRMDCDDSAFSEENICVDVDDGDTTAGKKSIALIMGFDPTGINILSDDRGDYIDKEGAGVSAGERSQPNPAAGIHLGLRAKPRIMRQLDLNIICEAIPAFPGHSAIDNCDQLPELFDNGGNSLGHGFLELFPECEGNDFCDLGAAVRPYKVNCPDGAPCPDIFTMLPSTRLPTLMIRDPVLMSFRLVFGGEPSMEVASAIGGGGSLDPGRCWSLHPDPAALAEAVCTTETGTHNGGDNSTDLVDSTRTTNFSLLDISVGTDIVKNVSDGSQGVITGVSNSTITVTLAGGTENDWDVGESYTIVRTSKCNVSVTAFDEGSVSRVGSEDGENDEWDVVANGVTALICDRGTSTVLGKATLTFGFKAIKKE